MWKSRLRQSPGSYQFKKLKESFDLFDPDSEGFISTQDLQKCILSLGINKIENDLQRRIKQCLGKETMVSFQTFSQIMQGFIPSDSQKDIRVIFQRFDFGNKGFINANDLLRVSKIIGENMTDKQIGDLLKISPNNEVPFQDFYKVMKQRSMGFF